MNKQLELFCSLLAHCNSFDDMEYLRNLASSLLTEHDFGLFMLFSFRYLGRCTIHYQGLFTHNI